MIPISTIGEFLESTTIHGLAHISTAKTNTARAIWVAIVVACFALAITMITGSYNQWQESPVSTTITTHPIDELRFPAVTVCPPRGLNTVINHALEKVKEINLTEKERQEMLNISRKVFLEIPNKNHAETVSKLFSPENIKSLANGRSSMPSVVDYSNTITLETNEVQGSFSTPGFGDSKHDAGDYYNQSQSLHYVLKFPKNIGDIIRDGSLVISVQTEDDWSYSWEKKMHVYEPEVTMPEAEQFCVNHDMHLASITSWSENNEVNKISSYPYRTVWLGARKNEEHNWEWLDGRPWIYQGTWKAGADPINGEPCLSARTQFMFYGDDELQWMDTKCTEKYAFVCIDATILTSGDHTFILRKDTILSPSLHFWWNHTGAEKKDGGMPGIQISWHLENGNKSADITTQSKEKNLINLINLAGEFTERGIDEAEVWKVLQKHRWCKDILDSSSTCLTESQSADVILKTKQELKLSNDSKTHHHDDPVITLGFQFYAALTFCPYQLIEARNLSIFFQFLIANETLTNIAAATFNNIQPRAGNSIQDSAAMNMWYKELAGRYNFSLGQILVDISTREQLNQLAKLDTPFLDEYKRSADYRSHWDSDSKIWILHSGDPLQQYNHPPHLLNMDNSNSSSAFIPFCAYRSQLVINRMETVSNLSFPICNAFRPTILEGQLCYKLDLNLVSGKGKRNELMLLLDYNNDRSIHAIPKHSENDQDSTDLYLDTIDSEQYEARVLINTLSPTPSFGGGNYKMTAVKRMTVTNDLLKMPLKDRKCEVEEYEDCRTRNLIKTCNCFPWKVSEFQGYDICSLEGRDCIKKEARRRFNCSVACQGIHSDIQWENEDMLLIEDKDWKNTVKDNIATKKGELLNRQKIAKLIKEYQAYKKNYVHQFKYDAEARSSNFVVELPQSTLRLVRIFFDTATFDNIERDKKIKTEAQLSLIGGTMGLLTGFSVISGVEIIFFLAKLLFKTLAHCRGKHSKVPQLT